MQTSERFIKQPSHLTISLSKILLVLNRKEGSWLWKGEGKEKENKLEKLP